MSTTYADYTRDRIGWLFGISGGQLIFLATASLPMFWAISQGAWLPALLLAGIWAFVLLVTIVPVHGRSATGWLIASTTYAFGGLLGWTSFRSKAAQGQAEDLGTPISRGFCRASRSTTARRTAPTCSGSRSSRTMPPKPGRSPPPSSTPASGWRTRRSGTATAKHSPL